MCTGRLNASLEWCMAIARILIWRVICSGKGVLAQLGIMARADRISFMQMLLGVWISTPILHSSYAINHQKIERLLGLDKASPKDDQ